MLVRGVPRCHETTNVNVPTTSLQPAEGHEARLRGRSCRPGADRCSLHHMHADDWADVTSTQWAALQEEGSLLLDLRLPACRQASLHLGQTDLQTGCVVP